jgi:Zn ribbon nucleic-acid-binding protein
MTRPSRPTAHTGLVCPRCRQPVSVVAHADEAVVMADCPACGHEWAAAAPGMVLGGQDHATRDPTEDERS